MDVIDVDEVLDSLEGIEVILGLSSYTSSAEIEGSIEERLKNICDFLEMEALKQDGN